MEKKVQKSNARIPKSLKLNKETICVLESSDLTHAVAGNWSRSFCDGTAYCCDIR